jgi:ATP-binding cassette subfamily F protein 3
MNILTLSKLKKEFSGDVLFQNISFDINSGDKIALIGKNGTGKTTLLKLILEQYRPDGGEIHKNKQATIGYLSQDVLDKTDYTLHDEMIHVFDHLQYLEQKMRQIEQELVVQPENEELLHRYSQIQHQYDVDGGYEYLYQIDAILHQFGFSNEEYDRYISTFSGGEKTRIAFAKLLLQQPDLLILDEPTNHLDIAIIDWLEEYLNRYRGAVLIVTHDKYFISKVCRKIVEIDQGTSHLYYGTFEMYQEEKIKRYELLLKRYVRQQKEIAHLQSFVDRFRYNAKRASIAQDRIKKIDRIDKLDKPTLSKRRVILDFEGRRPTTEIILEAKDLSIGYPQNELLKHVHFTMRGYEKMAIIGANGTGKTTLLKVIQNTLEPLSGRIEFLRQYKIGYFDQNQDTLHYEKTIFQEIHDAHPMFTNYDVRSYAARFLFVGDDLEKPIHILSGGEKVRLVLLLMMLEKPDLLVLDEPTNHLDIETKDIVEDVLSQFTGPIIFVSHDRYFINRVGTKILYLEPGSFTEFTGSYDDFKESRKPVVSETKKSDKKTVIQSPSLRVQLQEIESAIHAVENMITKLKQQTFEEDIYEDYQQLNPILDQIQNHEMKLQSLEQQYFTLLEELERNEV